MWTRLKLFILTATPTAILYALWLFSRRPKKKSQNALKSSTDQESPQIVPTIEVTDTDTDLQNEVIDAKLKSHKEVTDADLNDAKLNSDTEEVEVNFDSETKVSNITFQSVNKSDKDDCVSRVQVASPDLSKSQNDVGIATLKSQLGSIEAILPDDKVKPEIEVNLDSQTKVNSLTCQSVKENDEDDCVTRAEVSKSDLSMFQNDVDIAILNSLAEEKVKPESEAAVVNSQTKVNNTTLQTKWDDVEVNSALLVEVTNDDAKQEVTTSDTDVNLQTDGCDASYEMLRFKETPPITERDIKQLEKCIVSVESEMIEQNVGEGCSLKDDCQNVEQVIQCPAVKVETLAMLSEHGPEATSFTSDTSQGHNTEFEDLQACDDICVKAAQMENGISMSSPYDEPELVTESSVGQVSENGLESLESVKSIENSYLSNAVIGSENSESGGDYVSESGSETQDKYAVAAQKVDGAGDSPDGEAEKSRVVYQFDFPSDLCGRLIGKQGRNVLSIREKSGADIVVKNKLTTTTFRVVVLEGTKRQVTLALRLIKSKFPESRYPNVNYTQSVPEELLPPTESIMQLNLPLGVRMDVIVSRVIAANHVFVQQPSHPTFPHLELQMQMMLQCYDGDAQTPYLPQPYEVGVVCVALIDSFWYRVQVITVYSETDECDVKLVDYGGYVRVPGTALKQIRRDFTTLPFQAIECYLFGVISPSDEEDFPPEAASVLVELVTGSILQAEAVAVEEDQVPYILLTKLNGSQSKFINRELVNRGVARWLEL